MEIQLLEQARPCSFTGTVNPVVAPDKKTATNCSQTSRKSDSGRRFDLKLVIKLLAVLSLVAAYCYGFSMRQENELDNLQKHYPPGTSFKVVNTNPPVFEVVSEGEITGLHYVAIEKKHGYGGPVTVGTEVDRSGVVQRVIVIDQKETPVFFKKIREHLFFEQFAGREVAAGLELGKDIDSVSGATVSSMAFAKAVRLGSHAIAANILNMSVQEKTLAWRLGFKESVLLILYALVFWGVSRKIRKLRYLTLAAGCVFLGFYFNSAISLSNIAVIFLGYLPPLNEKLFWYLLVIGTLLVILIYGKNLYCFWMCPFGALQDLTAKIGGVNIQLGKKTLRYAGYMSYTLTWAALIMVFLTANSSIGSYEPFATLFGLEGFGVQWFILPSVILGSFFLNRFWCRFFCPVGVILKLTMKARSRVKQFIKGIDRWPIKAK